jgi:poly(A)-specific ribonuclease
VFVVRKLTPEERASADAEALELYNGKIGFRRIYRHLADSGKPVVGHNMFHDLLYLLSAFEGRLPKQFTDFKSLVHMTLPQIFDTKYIQNSIDHIREEMNSGPDNNLEKLYGLLKGT